MGFEKLQEIIRKVRKEHPVFSRRMSEAEAISRWEAAVGSQIAKHSSAIGVKQRILMVEVDHPIWRSELQYRKHQILENLNKASEDGAVLDDIWFLDPGRKVKNP